MPRRGGTAPTEASAEQVDVSMRHVIRDAPSWARLRPSPPLLAWNFVVLESNPFWFQKEQPRVFPTRLAIERFRYFPRLSLSSAFRFPSRYLPQPENGNKWDLSSYVLELDMRRTSI